MQASEDITRDPAESSQDPRPIKYRKDMCLLAFAFGIISFSLKRCCTDSNPSVIATARILSSFWKRT
uniref:Uncharacterized protein n=1 Tax=Romanomermis culicivorax TaxID=13658 RepID=A0A915KTH2_ROMCU